MFLRSPSNDSEFQAYYALRWKILREPWNQAPGSEKDEFEGEAIHLAAWNADGKLVGVGRLHRVLEDCGQIRFMAVDPEQRSHGVGRAILRELEIRAIQIGLQEIKLNSRQEAVQFYQKNGYQIVRAEHTLFGTIPHFEMRKRLR
jgi:N-acetylglutamate synthase-like GNAT family acetyltransferase